MDVGNYGQGGFFLNLQKIENFQNELSSCRFLNFMPLAFAELLKDCIGTKYLLTLIHEHFCRGEHNVMMLSRFYRCSHALVAFCKSENIHLQKHSIIYKNVLPKYVGNLSCLGRPHFNLSSPVESQGRV